MARIISPLQDEKKSNALGQALLSFARSAVRPIQRFLTPQYASARFISPTPTPTMTPMPTPTPTPTPTMTPTSTMMPTITPYPTPSLNRGQTAWGNELEGVATPSGVAAGVARAIGFNEASLNRYPAPNITEREETYGPAGINIRAHPQITRAQAESPEFAKNFMVNRLVAAKKLFPDNIEKQILYYNVPGNAYLDAKNISYQAAWYLQNALRTMGRTPSGEYLPVLRRYGFFT